MRVEICFPVAGVPSWPDLFRPSTSLFPISERKGAQIQVAWIKRRGIREKNPYAAFSRANSASKSKRNCAPSYSGRQFVICGKMVR